MIEINGNNTATLTAECGYCGAIGVYEMDENETATLKKYICYGRQMGYIQDLFPKVPRWIASGTIDTKSDGFCTCPECSPFS